MLIAFVGFKSSGKDSAARHLVEHFNFRSHSFAESLKDALAAIFVWDRRLLEGDTEESRRWRETVDDWWAAKLGIPHFTPRFAMQHVGTEVMRHHFNHDIWILNIERKLTKFDQSADHIVLVDGRFPNELGLARRYGGKVVRIRRGPEPEWYETARKANAGDSKALLAMGMIGVHQSEWAWIGQPIDVVVENDSTLRELYRQVEHVL